MKVTDVNDVHAFPDNRSAGVKRSSALRYNDREKTMPPGDGTQCSGAGRCQHLQTQNRLIFMKRSAENPCLFLKQEGKTLQTLRRKKRQRRISQSQGSLSASSRNV